MSRYRHSLPQLGERLFLTDGGLETTLVFHDGLELPEFAAFPLLRREDGEQILVRYFRGFAGIARRHGAGLILESATWRASADWGARLGYTPEALVRANRRAVDLLIPIRDEFDAPETPVVISGCLGPRGDGYVPSMQMSADEAERYHQPQARALVDAGVDMLCAMTLNTIDEAIGITRTAVRLSVPVAISFTVEVNARLATGETLRHAIEAVDDATAQVPAYYMINCAHPSHFRPALEDGGPWTSRIRGIRANASRKSHAELNESTELDPGKPLELAEDYASLIERWPQITVLGGCCGTDERHVECIADRCAPLFAARPNS
ncbi:MAG: homocysteine S-methyltransferase family protein [Phycisphaeraceae bacterium]|nr:homocysteine S-methyltransferase family protein [Phycisphaeraceae bacterium]